MISNRMYRLSIFIDTKSEAFDILNSLESDFMRRKKTRQD